MANKKKQKYPSKSQIRAEARRYVIKAGDYNGAEDSDTFMVSGHSTGSPYSEMEELSEQVTRDAGGYDYHEPEYASDAGETGYDLNLRSGLGDLGGPELYGKKPSLLKKSPIAHAGTSRGLAIGAAVGLAATAVLGGLAYVFYRSSLLDSSRGSSASKSTAKTATGGALAARTSSESNSSRGARGTNKSSETSSTAKSRSTRAGSAKRGAKSDSDSSGAPALAKSRSRRTSTAKSARV